MSSLDPSGSQFDKLQNLILTEYPNPERRGCPGDPFLRERAARSLNDSLDEDPRWHHVTHCSECYREFLGFRAGHQQRRIAYREKIATAALALITICMLVKWAAPHPERSQSAGLVFRPRVVDLQGRAMTIREEGKDETNPLMLDREPEELTVRLPFGSREGAYEVYIAKSESEPMVLATGETKLYNGTTTFKAKMDLSELESGRYIICLRRIPWDEGCYRVVVR